MQIRVWKFSNEKEGNLNRKVIKINIASLCVRVDYALIDGWHIFSFAKKVSYITLAKHKLWWDERNEVKDFSRDSHSSWPEIFFLLNFKRFLFLMTTSSIFTTMMILHSFLWLSYKVLHISFNILPNREVLENIFVYLFDLSTFSFFLNKK